MKHQYTQTLGDAIREFFEKNSDLQQRIGEVRVQRGWEILLGPAISRYTRSIYVKEKVLYVYLTSSVLRSELLLCRERLVKRLNEYAGLPVIEDLIIR